MESTPQRLFPHKSFDRWKTVEAQYMTIEGARNIFQGFLAFLDGCTSSAKKDCHIDTLSSTTLSSCLKSRGIRFLGCAIGWYVRGCRECWKRFWQIERKPFESYLTVEKSYLAHMKFNSHPPHHSICEGRGTGDVWHALKIWIWNDSLNHFFINVQKMSCTKSMTLFSNVNCRHLSNGKKSKVFIQPMVHLTFRRWFVDYPTHTQYRKNIRFAELQYMCTPWLWQWSTGCYTKRTRLSVCVDFRSIFRNSISGAITHVGHEQWP